MKRILPVALIVLGMLLLSGCLFVPAFNRTIRGKDVADQVGPADSKKPLRLNNATMDQVIELLGDPQYASLDGRRIAYTWQVLNGEWIMPLCFTTEEQYGARAMELTFDSDDRLVDYAMKKMDGSLNLLPVAIAAPSAVSPDLHSTAMQAWRRATTTRSSTTRKVAP